MVEKKIINQEWCKNQMDNEAKYIGKCKHKYDDGFDLIYTYKGYEYRVTNNQNDYMKSIKKHDEEQKRIEYIINNNKRSITFDPEEIYEIQEYKK